MKLTFRIEYRTAWGEELGVILDGNNSEPIILRTPNGEHWEGEAEMPDLPACVPVSYRYGVYRDGQCIRRESGTMAHLFCPGKKKNCHYILNDFWKDLPAESYLYSSAFSGDYQSETTIKVTASADGSITFRALCPCLHHKRQVLAISGDCPALGNWDIQKTVLMEEIQPNEWTITLNVSTLEFPLSYKFVACNADSKQVEEWENHDNRMLNNPELKKGEIYLTPETEVHFTSSARKVAGTAIPVFSLRSEKSFGVGDFGDLKKLIDWAAKTHHDSPYKYNATFGYRKGQVYNSSRNSYHKPQISLNHLWQIDHKSSLSTAVYASIGRGNGYSGTGTSEYRNKWYGASYGNLNWDFRHEDGTFNYDAIDELNASSTSGSKMVMAKAMNNHEWYGLLSTYTTKIGEYFDFYGGIDYRYYKGLHQNIITDLFSGKYYVDYNRGNVLAVNNAAANNPDFVNQKLGVGDVVYRDYDGFVMSEGVFAQLEYNRDKLSAFVSGGVSNTSYWRYDRFYYDEAHAKSSKKHYLGGNIKGGANYNLTEHHNVFFNAGYISRAPMFDTSFINSQNSHERNPDAVNEKVMSFELGYGFRSSVFTANVNAYYTKWIDKSLYDSSTGTNGERYTLNMTGANAKHMGVEVDFEARPTRWMSINGMFSWGDWRWDGLATGFYFNSEGQMVTAANGNVVADMSQAENYRYKIRMDNVNVGGSAQTTAALGVTVRPMDGLRIGLDWNFAARLFADYDIEASDAMPGEEYIVGKPWQVPSYHVFDLNAGYTFDFGKVRATLSGNINNLFNQEYIADAWDGSTWEDVERVIYGFGRTYSVRLKFNF